MVGALIAIEGIDGAGTTTQARLLVDWLNQQGLPAHLTCEPSTGPVGQLIRAVLKAQTSWPLDAAAVALLFAADRVDHYQHEMRPLLQAGTHVVTDRSVYSSLAYQSLEQDLAWVDTINRLAPEPDLVLYVRVPPDLARQRREARGGSPELYDDTRMQERISAQYDLLLGSSLDAGSWRLDPAGSDWIRRSDDRIRLDPAGSGCAILTRCPRTAIVDGALPVDRLHEQLRALGQKVAHGDRT